MVKHTRRTRRTRRGGFLEGVKKFFGMPAQDAPVADGVADVAAGTEGTPVTDTTTTTAGRRRRTGRKKTHRRKH